jgi:hypothetical protein
MRSRQSSLPPRAFQPGARLGLRGIPAQQDRRGLSVSDAVTGMVDAVIGRAFANPKIRSSLLDDIRIIIREELARTPFADRLMDAAEAAERLGMTEAALRKAAARGKVPCEHRGRRLRFRLSALMGDVEARRENQGPAAAGASPTTSSTLP